MAKKKAAEATEEKQVSVNVTVEETGPCQKKVTVEVPEAMIQEKLDEQFKDLSREALVPGFRKGRAPMRLIMKRFGEDVREQVKLKILAESSEDAMKSKELDVLNDPDIDYKNITLPESGSMSYDFEVEVRPDFELPSLEKIPVEKVKIEMTEDQIEEQIEDMRRRMGVWAPKDGVVEEGDQVVADVHLKVEGEAEDEKLDNTEVFAREKGFVGGVPVDDLAKLLKGAKAGDEKKTSVQVPATFFNEKYRDKKVDIRIEVKEVKQLEPAELNEEFFGRYGVEDEEELRDSIRDMREAQAEREARSAMGDQVYKYLLENTQFDLPANVVAQQSVRILQRQYTNMLMQGMQREQMEEQMETLRASSEEQAREQLKLYFIMDKIADKLEVEVTEEEINGHIAQAAAQRGRRPEKMREELARDGSLDQFRMQVREQKCIEKLLEDAEISEVDAKKAAKKTTKKATKKKTTKKKTAKKKEADTQSSREATAKKRKKATKKKKSE